jgi:predicted transcriptional regulator YdeE
MDLPSSTKEGKLLKKQYAVFNIDGYLQECYESVTEIANHWIDVLDTIRRVKVSKRVSWCTLSAKIIA